MAKLRRVHILRDRHEVDTPRYRYSIIRFENPLVRVVWSGQSKRLKGIDNLTLGLVVYGHIGGFKAQCVVGPAGKGTALVSTRVDRERIVLEAAGCGKHTAKQRKAVVCGWIRPPYRLLRLGIEPGAATPIQIRDARRRRHGKTAGVIVAADVILKRIAGGREVRLNAGLGWYEHAGRVVYPPIETVFGNRVLDRLILVDTDAEIARQRWLDGGTTAPGRNRICHTAGIDVPGERLRTSDVADEEAGDIRRREICARVDTTRQQAQVVVKQHLIPTEF